MLLKSIKLKNFRQFVDGKIEFSTDKEKNVTLVLARNKTGKTTLTNAFTWCLFGITNFKDKTVLNRKIRHNLMPRESIDVSVEVELQYGQHDYCIRRIQKFTNNQTLRDADRLDSSTAFLSISDTDIDTGLTKPIDDSKKQELLDSLIPQDLSEYFFMRAEEIASMSDAFQTDDSDEKFASAVKKILGMQPIEKAIKHLYDQPNNSVYALFQKDYKSNSNKKIQDINDEIIELEKTITENDQFIKRADSAIPILTKQIGDLAAEIAKWEEPKKQQEKMNELNEKVATEEISQNNVKSKYLKSFAKDLPSLCLKNIVPEIISTLKDTKVEEKFVPDVTEKTIKTVIKRGKCICGTNCEIGTEAHKTLVDLLAYIPPQSLGSLVSSFLKEARIYTSNDTTANMLQEYKDTERRLMEIQSNIDDYNEQISDIQNSLKEHKDTGKLEEEKEQKTSDLKTLSVDKAKKEAENEINRGELDKKRAKLNELASADEDNKKVIMYQKHTKYLYDILKKTLTEKENLLRESLTTKMNEIFSSVFGESYKIVLNKNYKLSITDAYDKPEKIDTSGAQGVYILLSFITSVLYLARPDEHADVIDNSEEILISEPYPLVLDAPLSNFDDDIIPDICEKLPELTEQIVIFSKYLDGKLIKEHMKERIGKFYTMSPELLDNNKEDVLETKIEEGDI